jgi:hypothetical protein
MASDFETTFLKALARACVSVFGGGTTDDYERLLASSCSVHRSRFLLRRCGKNPRALEYAECMNASSISSVSGVEAFVTKMETWPNFADCAVWLRENNTGRIMFFRGAYCTLPAEDWYSGVFADTNPNEAMNGREKRLRNVVDQCRRGTALQVVRHCRDLDARDSRNIAWAFGGSSGLQIRASTARRKADKAV